MAGSACFGTCPQAVAGAWRTTRRIISRQDDRSAGFAGRNGGSCLQETIERGYCADEAGWRGGLPPYHRANPAAPAQTWVPF